MSFPDETRAMVARDPRRERSLHWLRSRSRVMRQCVGELSLGKHVPLTSCNLQGICFHFFSGTLYQLIVLALIVLEIIPFYD